MFYFLESCNILRTPIWHFSLENFVFSERTTVRLAVEVDSNSLVDLTGF